jgi:hypothetical protein
MHGLLCGHEAAAACLVTAADPDTIEHGLLLPILFHCVDDAGRPVLDPALFGPGAPSFARNVWHDIPGAVEAIRQFWMPKRFKLGA